MKPATTGDHHGLHQRWSPRGRPWPRGRPRGQILKSLALALASKVKSLALASRPQVLENWPVLGSRTALFFGKLKFCGAVEKFFGKRFFVEIAWKIFVKTFFFFFLEIAWKIFVKTFFFFFLESTCALCPWSLASRVSVLGKAVLGLGLGLGFFLCPWPWPWPRALCPRLHLWFAPLQWGPQRNFIRCTYGDWKLWLGSARNLVKAKKNVFTRTK